MWGSSIHPDESCIVTGRRVQPQDGATPGHTAGNASILVCGDYTRAALPR
jgi:hypothetical protein